MRQNLSDHQLIVYRRIFLAAVLFAIVLTTGSQAFADGGAPAAESVKDQMKQAQKFVRRGEFGEAEKILRRVLADNPQNSDIKLALSNVFLKQKKLVEAFDLAAAVAKSDSQNAAALALLGAIYLADGSFQEARILVNSALQIDRREALGWATSGLLDFYENRLADSLTALQTAVGYEPRDPDYIFSLAQVAARAERYKFAAVAYQKFLDVAPFADKERRERIEGLIRFLNFLGVHGAIHEVSGNEQTVVPITLINDRPLIEVRINKKSAPLKFILDTGSNISVMSEKTARRLGIKPITRGGNAQGVGGDGKFEIVYGFLRSVEIGAVKINSVPVYIRPLQTPNDGIDGYIGLGVVANFLMTLDYGNLTLSLKNKLPVAPTTTEEEEFRQPLHLTSGGFLSGEVRIEGIKIPLNFIVDTGASISVISHEIAGLDAVSRYLEAEKMRVVGAAGVTDDVSAFMLPNLSFGVNTREQVRAISLDLNVINETTGFQQAGILGGNFLKNYRLTFDFTNLSVIFTPLKKSAEQD